MEPGLKGAVSKLSMASTTSSTSSKDCIPTNNSSSTRTRKVSPWATGTGGGGSYSKLSSDSRSSREASPASIDYLSMDELDTCTEQDPNEEAIVL